MYLPEVELLDNPVLNLLRVNKWVRENLGRLRLLQQTVGQWQATVEEGSGVYMDADVVAILCKGNNLTIIEIRKGDLK